MLHIAFHFTLLDLITLIIFDGRAQVMKILIIVEIRKVKNWTGYEDRLGAYTKEYRVIVSRTLESGRLE
jgi:hypothetical protein